MIDKNEIEIAAQKGEEKLREHLFSAKTASAYDIYLELDSLLEWANYLFSFEKTGNCDEFIDGFRSSLVETIFCVSMGITRLALFTMRSQIDICLSWLYFKDHPMEYAKVQKSSDGFMLKSAVIQYLDSYMPGFRYRFLKLSENLGRNEKDPYRLLSAHVHSQSHQTLPAVGSFEEMIADEKTSKELLLVQAEVTEYLSDVLFSCFGGKWANLPKPLLEKLKSRLPADVVSFVLS